MKSMLKRAVLLGLAIALAACSWPVSGPNEPTRPAQPDIAAEQPPQARVTFEVITPVNSPEDQEVAINILDEVTGLAINVESHTMENTSPQRYAISLDFPNGSVVKYRYSRLAPAAPVEEHLSDERQVRYRLYSVDGSGQVEDVVSRWTDTPYIASSGRIMGQVTEASTGIGIPNILVTAGGAQTFTSADGAYLLEGLPPGTHNVVAYALDGSYRTYQQGAVVASEATTPAPLVLQQAPLVDVTFRVSAPEGTVPAVPLRLAGNLYQLGNTFGDLRGGLSTIAGRMPVMTPLPDRQYSLTMSLPVGADVRYFYTLGDGFWNTEKTAGGSIPVRQLIIPEEPLRIEDEIVTWRKGGDLPPLTFDIRVPESTPAGEQVSIQFDPLIGWMEPLPLWQLSPTRWVYVLNDPVDLASTMRYRVCRNSQCGAADDSNTAGMGNQGLAVRDAPDQPDITYQVEAWSWHVPGATSYAVNPVPVTARSTDFMAGIELQPAYHPTWNAYLPGAYGEIRQSGANWVVQTPTWRYTRNSPPILEIVPGRDPIWQDMVELISASRGQNLSIALFPSALFPEDPETWWAQGRRDFSWWIVWFEQYRRFAIHHAEMAARTGAQSLVLGGEWLEPALPGGRLADGTASGVPPDADQRWREILSAVRQHYAGPLAWAIPYEQAASQPPAFLDAVDQLYLLFSPPLTENLEAAPEEIAAAAGTMLDEYILPLRLRLEKPVILAAGYASTNGAATSCLPAPAGGCLPASALSRPQADIPTLPVDLQEQANIYQGLLMAVNDRYWINGFTSRGYYPPIALQDKSTSIHGKPAASVLAYWYPRLLGTPTP